MDSTPPPRKRQTKIDDALLLHWNTLSDREIAKRLGVSNGAVSRHRRALEDSGLLLPRLDSTHHAEACLREVCTSAIRPSPQNDLIYSPIDKAAPAFVALKDDIAKNGLLEPLIVCRDGMIISGHRRYAALCELGRQRVLVRIRPDVSYRDNRDAFLRLLASCNRQRPKTAAEQMREEIALANEQSGYEVRRFEYERTTVAAAGAVELRDRKARSEIRDKLELRQAIIDVIEAERDNWPLSDRGVHYRLLNVSGLVRNDKTRAPYRNDAQSYNDVTGMLTRLRLDGSIPFDSIADETRGVTLCQTHACVGDFVRDEIDGFLIGYWRTLQQSQPNWVELLAEKNTIAAQLRQLALKYQLPMTSGRGYSSLPPRKDMVDRFRASGREKLVVIVVADFDPEGEDIPESFGASLRDDFGVPERQLVVVKAALTHQQVQSLDLHEGQLSKATSSRYGRFAQRYGPRCWELESLPTEQLRRIVEQSIRGVLDLDAFERELATQRREQDQLAQRRQDARDALLALWAEEGGA